MFQPPTTTGAVAGALQSNPFLKRAALFGGALLLLLLAFQLLPSAEPPDPSRLYSDESGTVATKVKPEPAPRREAGGFKPGYLITILLLAAGGAFAIYLRRNGTPGAPLQTPIRHVSAFQLAPGQQLRLVSFSDEVLLLGVTSGQITLLKSYAAEDLRAAEPVHTGESQTVTQTTAFRPQAPSFAALLQHFSGTAATPAEETKRWPA